MFPTSGFSGLGAAKQAVDGLAGLFVDVISVWPIVAAYTPRNTLQLSDLVLGTGTLGELVGPATPEAGDVYQDPSTGNSIWLFPSPAGGWVWQYNGSSPAPPVTIFGFACADDSGSGGTNLYGVTLPLAAPITLSRAGLIIAEPVEFIFPPSVFLPQ